MIELDYDLDPKWVDELTPGVAEASIVELDFWFFFGDVTFRAKGIDFIAEQIAVLGFARGLVEAVRGLERESEYLYLFNEGEGVIRYVRDGDELRITSNYGGIDRGVGTVAFEELRGAAARFHRRVVLELVARYPDLAKNPSMASDLKQLEGDAGTSRRV